MADPVDAAKEAGSKGVGLVKGIVGHFGRHWSKYALVAGLIAIGGPAVAASDPSVALDTVKGIGSSILEGGSNLVDTFTEASTPAPTPTPTPVSAPVTPSVIEPASVVNYTPPPATTSLDPTALEQLTRRGGEDLGTEFASNAVAETAAPVAPAAAAAATPAAAPTPTATPWSAVGE